MSIAETDQTTLNKGSVRIPRNTGKLATQRKRFELGAASTYSGGFPVVMDELMALEAAEASIEKALSGTPNENYRAQVEAIAGNIVTVGVQEVLSGAEILTNESIDLDGFIFVVTGAGY